MLFWVVCCDKDLQREKRAFREIERRMRFCLYKHLFGLTHQNTNRICRVMLSQQHVDVDADGVDVVETEFGIVAAVVVVLL